MTEHVQTSPSPSSLPPDTSPRERDNELVQRAREGDENAYTALFHLYKQRVFSLCLQMGRDRGEAEDLTQEAFLQVFRKLSTFRGVSSFSTWLYRVTVNVILMNRRRQQCRVQPVSWESDTPDGRGWIDTCGYRDPYLAGSVDRLSIANAVIQLAPGYRTIFVLHDLQGRCHQEIAHQLRCSVGTSKSQLFKARQKLRQILRLSYRKGMEPSRSKTKEQSSTTVQNATMLRPAYR